MTRYLRLFLLGLAACAPAAEPPRASVAAQPADISATKQHTNLVGTLLQVPDTDITFTLNEAFWQGERVPFGGPGNDRGTLRQAASGLRLQQRGRDVHIIPLEVQRVSGAGGLYLVVLGGTPERAKGSAFLGKNVRLIRLEHASGVTTAVTVDARLGRPTSTAMQPGRVHRFYLREGTLLELP